MVKCTFGLETLLPKADGDHLYEWVVDDCQHGNAVNALDKKQDINKCQACLLALLINEMRYKS